MYPVTPAWLVLSGCFERIAEWFLVAGTPFRHLVEVLPSPGEEYRTHPGEEYWMSRLPPAALCGDATNIRSPCKTLVPTPFPLPTVAHPYSFWLRHIDLPTVLGCATIGRERSSDVVVAGRTTRWQMIAGD